MAEYIEKNKVINLIEHNDRVCHYADERYENVVYATAQTICKVVAEMPSADVQPVKHGQWIEVTPKHSRCSVCDTTCLIAVYPISKGANYCPNCGARMDGDTNG